MKATQELTFFEVGGCVRDELLGLDIHDVDFSVEAESFEAMVAGLESMGFKIFQTREEFLTVRAGVPKSHALRERTKDADFVMCRADGPTADGRRPEFVTPGTILDDLARRDFTVNAIAREENGTLFDPFGGIEDVANRVLRFVGNPADRIAEDGLRVLRGFRFMVTKGFVPTPETDAALRSDLACEMLEAVSLERVREELDKMFKARTLQSMHLVTSMSPEMQGILFRGDLHLTASLKAR